MGEKSNVGIVNPNGYSSEEEKQQSHMAVIFDPR